MLNEVIFDQNNLALVEGVDLYNFNPNDLPNRDIKINKLARRDLSIITSSEYSSKNITVWADVCSGSRSDTEVTISYLKSLVQRQNGILQVPQNGMQIRYTATMNGFSMEWHGNKAYIEITFIASDPIGKAVDSVEFASVTTTSSSNSLTETFLGSATVEPTITVTINSVTGGTGGVVSIYNGGTNQGIEVTANWVAGDVLTIESSNKKARINGLLVDFSGIFPTWPSGMQTVIYNDNFTTRNATITVDYKPSYV